MTPEKFHIASTPQLIKLSVIFWATSFGTVTIPIKAFNSLYTVGDSVYAYNLYYVLNNHSEIKNVTNFKVKKHSESSYADSVAIGKRELALLAEDNITINQSV